MNAQEKAPPAENDEKSDDEKGSVDFEENPYINASLMKGYFDKERSKQRFIATQAPLDDTIDTFWQMTWLHKVSRVYCLTKTAEAGKIQASAYWKTAEDGTSLTKAPESYKVYLKHQQEDCFATQREFELECLTAKQIRKVTHFHTEVWDDDAVPTKPEHVKAMVQLARDLNAHLDTHSEEKAVVHCSAGIGRTAVFLAACDIIGFVDRFAHRSKAHQLSTLEEACSAEPSQEQCAISIFDIVRCLREQRWGSVKTFEQYKFLYELTGKVLNEHFPS